MLRGLMTEVGDQAFMLARPPRAGNLVSDAPCRYSSKRLPQPDPRRLALAPQLQRANLSRGQAAGPKCGRTRWTDVPPEETKWTSSIPRADQL